MVIEEIEDFLLPCSICTDCKFTLFFLNISKFQITFFLTLIKRVVSGQNNNLVKKEKIQLQQTGKKRYSVEEIMRKPKTEIQLLTEVMRKLRFFIYMRIE